MCGNLCEGPKWGCPVHLHTLHIPKATTASALFGAKTIGFFEIFDVSARTGGEEGWANADIFGQVGQFFEICADVFYGRLYVPCLLRRKVINGPLAMKRGALGAKIQTI